MNKNNNQMMKLDKIIRKEIMSYLKVGRKNGLKIITK